MPVMEPHVEAAAASPAIAAGAAPRDAALATLVETTYHGAMIGWALHREGSLPAWMRQQLEAVLAPLRG